MPLSIQVGEALCRTSKETLTGESRYFKRLLRPDRELRPDQAIFVDRNGPIFEHILEYLRTGQYPLFYDAATGHDEILYGKLLVEARFFEIDKLEACLSQRRYWNVVKTKKYVQLSEQPFSPTNTTLPVVVEGRNGSVVEVQPFKYTRKVYVCPRGIPVHMDHEELCGRACREALGDDDPFENETEHKFLQFHTRVEIQRELLNSKTKFIQGSVNDGLQVSSGR